MGYTVKEAKRYKTPGGNKPYRLPDLTAISKTGDMTAIQVGVLTKGGRPVGREVAAMKDLELATEFRQTLFFPYK